MKTILLYTFYTVIASIIGIAIPYFKKLSNFTIKLFMTISASVLVGITFAHLIPESVEQIGKNAIISIMIGFFVPILLERFSKKDDYKSNHHGDLPLFNILTIVAFSLHSFIDGLLLNNELVSHTTGLAVYTGVIAHKIPVAFSLMTILKTHLSQSRKRYLFLIAFILMTPVGAITGFYLLNEMSQTISHQLTSITSGIFIYIALIHLYYDHKLYTERKLNIIFVIGFIFSGILFSIGVH